MALLHIRLPVSGCLPHFRVSPIRIHSKVLVTNKSAFPIRPESSRLPPIAARPLDPFLTRTGPTEILCVFENGNSRPLCDLLINSTCSHRDSHSMDLVDAFLTLTLIVLGLGLKGDFGQATRLSSKDAELSNQSQIRLTRSANLSTSKLN